MSEYDFSRPIERRGTGSIKWSGGEESSRWVPAAAEGDITEVDMLPMWLADMDFAIAPEIQAALHRRVDFGMFGYSTYTEAFYGAITTWNDRRHGWTPSPESILVNNGVMPAISLAIQTFTEPGDHVIAQPPVFHPITEAAELNGRRTVHNPLILDDGRYRMDLEDLADKAAHPRAKMMVICSPHNPIGRVWSAGELRDVADICREFDLILISDEIHADLTYPWAEFTTAGMLGAQYNDRLIICTGPSKAFNLPALKLSLTIIPDAGLRERFSDTLNKQNELWSANLLGAAALEAAYTEGQPWLDVLLDELQHNVTIAAEFLAERLPEVSLGRPDALYLLWIDCRATGFSDEELTDRLHGAGLWVEQGATYGSEGRGFIRMTIATPRVLLEEGLARLERALLN